MENIRCESPLRAPGARIGLRYLSPVLTSEARAVGTRKRLELRAGLVRLGLGIGLGLGLGLGLGIGLGLGLGFGVGLGVWVANPNPTLASP